MNFRFWTLRDEQNADVQVRSSNVGERKPGRRGVIYLRLHKEENAKVKAEKVGEDGGEDYCCC